MNEKQDKIQSPAPESTGAVPEAEAETKTGAGADTAGASEPAEAATEKSNGQKNATFSKKRKFKHGAYAAAVTAALIAVLIGLNIVATVLADRFPLHLDITADKSFTVTPENAEYIKDLARDVTVTLCASKEDYTGGMYADMLQNSYISDTSGGVFFDQTVFLLEEYDRLSSHVKFSCADPQDPSFTRYTQAYPEESFSFGDVLVEAEFRLDDRTVKRHRLLTMEDLYTVDSSSYSYSLTESTVETAVTSAIYAVTSDKSYKVALLTANGAKKQSDMQSFLSELETNNYEITEVENLLTGEIPEDTDLVIIAAPTADYTGAELQKVEQFLDLNGSRGKSVLYIADASQPVLPNLQDFLAEWGFDLKRGVVYETDADNYMPPYPTFVRMDPASSDYTEEVDTNLLYLGMNNVPITKRFEEHNNKTIYEVLHSLETSVIMPSDADDSWEPTGKEEKGPFVSFAVSEDEKYTDDDSVSSRVLVLSGLNFVTNTYLDYASVGNLDVARVILDRSVGREDEGISFTARTVNSESYSDQVTQTSVIVMRVIFLGVVPVAILLVGMAIWLHRRRL